MELAGFAGTGCVQLGTGLTLTVTGQAASVVLADEDGRVLMVRHAYGLRRYSLPGGIVEPGESPEAAAAREALEETGLKVLIRDVLGVYLVQGGGCPDVLSHVYRATAGEAEPVINDPNEISQILWVNPLEPPQPLTNDARVALPDYVAGLRGVRRTVQRLA